jgi:hypothetical protein
MLLAAAPVQGQAHHMPEKNYHAALGVNAIGLLTHATPAVDGRSLTEAYLTQPNIFLHAAARFVEFQATVNLEGQTLQRGELNAGTWGEGYVDRRHPHTYLHEAVVTVGSGAFGGIWSLTAGKGFAPFGTDDPMVRPLLKFPANHHLLQILERLIVVGAVQKGPLILEAGLFNGDEPIDPSSLGRLSRFGDSWSARVTGLVGPDIELQASHAYLTSPELPTGGVDQSKWSASLRYESVRHAGADTLYGLVEWARTADVHDGNEVRRNHGALAEGAAVRGRWRAAFRLERTVRAEEERTTSIFRTPWPPLDLTTFGFTRWVIATAAVSHRFTIQGLNLTPSVEVSHQRPKAVAEPVFSSRAGIWFRPSVEFFFRAPRAIRRPAPSNGTLRRRSAPEQRGSVSPARCKVSW